MNQPKLFIGSASESLDIARALEYELRGEIKTEVWDKCFRPGQYTLEELKRKAKEVDFAVFILGQEDKTESRGDITLSPRDNVVYEAGLFAGYLGVEKVFLLIDAMGTKMPTDWKGLGYLSYDKRFGNLNEAVGQAAIIIRKEISDWKNSIENSVEQQIQGYWWDFVLNLDEGSVIGLKKISCSPGFKNWKISGESWKEDGKKAAEFESTIASFDSKENKLIYAWEGRHPFNKNVTSYFGLAEIRFEVDENGNINKATGHFSSTNENKVEETTVRYIIHQRASKQEVEIAKGNDLKALQDII